MKAGDIKKSSGEQQLLGVAHLEVIQADRTRERCQPASVALVGIEHR